MVDTSGNLIALLLLVGGLCIAGALVVLALVVMMRRTASREAEDDYAPATGQTLPPEVLREVEQLLADGYNIDAIKRVRQATGWSLGEAKTYVVTLNETGAPPRPTEEAQPDLGDLPDEVAHLLQAKQKIEAVRRVREATGWGLKESKDYVDAIQDTGVPPTRVPPIKAAAPAPPAALTDLPAEVTSLLLAKQKIEAVKRVRESTGWGLKESKDYVDDIERTL